MRAGTACDLARRLATALPDVVMGVKDSSGDWPSTEKLIAELGAQFERIVGGR